MVLRGFLKKELIQMLRNPVMVFALLLMPVIQSFLFSYAITNEPKNISITMRHNINDYIMNRIYDHSIASGWFLKSKTEKTNPFGVIKSGEADVALIAPAGGLSKDIVRRDGQGLQVLIDASNVLRAQAVSGYIRSIITKILNDELLKKATNKCSMINFETRILFNPEMDTKMFIVPSVMVMIVAMSILSLVCISIAKEKETGTMETLISAPIEKKHLILGKTLPSIVIALFNLVSIAIVGLFIFKVPFRGGIICFMLAFVAFSFAMASLGVFMSTFCSNQQQALMFIMIVLFLAMMLSGAMFPVETMPAVLKFFANMDPLTHFIYLARNIMLKGGHADYFVKHIWPMLAFGTFFSVVGVKRFKQTL